MTLITSVVELSVMFAVVYPHVLRAVIGLEAVNAAIAVRLGFVADVADGMPAIKISFAAYTAGEQAIDFLNTC